MSTAELYCLLWAAVTVIVLDLMGWYIEGGRYIDTWNGYSCPWNAPVTIWRFVRKLINY